MIDYWIVQIKITKYMKTTNIYHYLIIACFSLVSSSVFAQFEFCNSNTTKTLRDLYFFDEHTGIAVGDSGVIIRSTDGGENWSEIMHSDSIIFRKVKFWDDNHGVAIGTKLYTTSNGGLDWQKQEVSTIEFFADVELFDNYKFILTGSNNTVFRLQFENDEINVLSENILEYEISHMSFINDSIGFAYHRWQLNSILKTTNGGLTWTKLDFDSDDVFTVIEDINFITEDIGFFGGWYDSKILRTIDGGLNWDLVNIEDSNNTVFDFPGVFDFHIDLNTTDKFYVSGWHGEIFKSNDLGSNWKKMETPIACCVSLNGIYFVDDNTGWVVGDQGTILKTTNGGELTASKNISTINIDVYPNPFTDFIKINLPKDQIKSLELFNLAGELIKSTDQNELKNLGHLSNGNYLLVIESNNTSNTFSIIKI